MPNTRRSPTGHRAAADPVARVLIGAIALGALILGVPASATISDVGNAYRFGDQDLLGPAHLWAAWQQMLDQHELEVTRLRACTRDDCPGIFVGSRILLRRAQSLPFDKQVKLVNAYVNKRRYRNDHGRRDETTGQRTRSTWATLESFLRRGGDCEDYATAKYFLLREMGIPAQRMRVVVAYDRKVRSHHAVLAVQKDDETVWLLESDDTIRKYSHRGYRYVYAVNELSIWDHGGDR